MCGPVEHVAIIIGIIQVVENAGVDANVNYQEGNEEKTRKRHHYFLAYG